MRVFLFLNIRFIVAKIDPHSAIDKPRISLHSIWATGVGNCCGDELVDFISGIS